MTYEPITSDIFNAMIDEEFHISIKGLEPVIFTRTGDDDKKERRRYKRLPSMTPATNPMWLPSDAIANKKFEPLNDDIQDPNDDDTDSDDISLETKLLTYGD